jgi:hypothetical protein
VSALKQLETSPLKHAEDQKHWHGPRYLPESYGGRNVREEFKQWKEDNPDHTGPDKMEWINNWKEEVNDPTMPSVQQADEIVLPKWAQEEYGLKEGAVLGDNWNTLIPSSGGSHHSRIVGMESGLSAAVPHEKHDNFEDNRTAEQKKADEMNYKQIVSEAGGEDSEDYLKWKKGQDEIELKKKQEMEAKEKEAAEAKRLEEEAAEAKRLEEEKTARNAQLDKGLKNATSDLDYQIANSKLRLKGAIGSDGSLAQGWTPEDLEQFKNSIADMEAEREQIVNQFEKIKSGEDLGLEQLAIEKQKKDQEKDLNEPVKFGYHTEEGEVK